MLTKIHHHLPSPLLSPTTMFLYILVSLVNWKSGLFSKSEIPILYHDIKREKGIMKTFIWLHMSHGSTHKLRGHVVEEQAKKGIIHSHLIFSQKYRKSCIPFKKEGRWEIWLFKLGIYPIEILHIQKLKYSKPTTTQKLESPQQDYYTRNNMFIGS